MTTRALSIVIMIVVFGGIALSTAVGGWSTTSTKIPVTFQSGEFAGEYDPSDIRGSYGFTDISSLFDIPLDVLAEAFALPDSVDPQSFKSKDLESMYAGLGIEIGNGSMKLFVALYNGLPYDYKEDDTFLPASAVKILERSAELSSEEIGYLKQHTVYLESIPTGANSSDGQEESWTVKGKTTFRDLLDLGVSKGDIEQVIDESMPSQLLTVRDFCAQKGLQFSSIKAELQAIVDSIH